MRWRRPSPAHSQSRTADHCGIRRRPERTGSVGVPAHDDLDGLHLGQLYDTFFARNLTDRMLVGSAVPAWPQARPRSTSSEPSASVSPSRTLPRGSPGHGRAVHGRSSLPEFIDRITLSYTFSSIARRPLNWPLPPPDFRFDPGRHRHGSRTGQVLHSPRHPLADHRLGRVATGFIGVSILLNGGSAAPLALVGAAILI